MSAAMAHRGPDGQGDFFSQQEQVQIGLGHRRLSIIDLSNAANQPMHYDELSVVFNGEIYNYNEIRRELILLGHEFTTHSDTEVILHAWRHWGEQCIEKWIGMFAIALFDRKTNELICIRDRVGVKPFHYYWNQNTFIFGSELKSLMEHPAFEKTIDSAATASFLQYGYISAPHCIFKNTFKLEPGHVLKINLSTTRITTRQYWNVYDYYNRPKLNISLEEAIEETERVLENAFQYRMVADVPVGVFLSGGFDSTCVTALLQKNSPEKIKTFTIGTSDGKLDEAPFAKQIAAHLGTDHTEYYCTPKEALEIIPKLPFYYDEPFADSSAIPTILVSQLARQKVTVALSADAGDEIFAGYNRYDYISRYGARLRKIPEPLRKMGVWAMEAISSNRIPILRESANFHSRYDKLKNLLNDPSPSELLKNISHVFSNSDVKGIFAGELVFLSTPHNSKELKPEYYDALSFMMAVDYQTYLADDILQKVDRATMSTSLEGREPFLDQHIIQWVAQLPSEYKYHQGIKKYILRSVVHKFVPKELMERPKMGFGIPLADWLSNELRPLVEEYLGDGWLRRHDLFDNRSVWQLKKDFFSGRKEKYLKIWHLLMFQMWYAKWMQ